jgi:hypothetical protein
MPGKKKNSVCLYDRIGKKWLVIPKESVSGFKKMTDQMEEILEVWKRKKDALQS